MICVAVLVFLQRSMAVQVRVRILVQPMTLVEAPGVTGSGPSQLSMAVTTACGGTSLGHCRLRLTGGRPRRSGLMVSTTEMICAAVLVFLQRSMAVQVRVMILVQPTALVEAPGVTGSGPSQLSMAVTTSCGGTSLRHCTLRFTGGTPTRTGLMVSTNVMICVATFVFL